MNSTIQVPGPQLPSIMSPDEAQALITLYVANPAFRSASDQELILHDTPCRRPVRPEDLEFLDYRTPLKANQVLDLSALIGHRMLLNINETDFVLLPPGKNVQAWKEFEAFYSQDNRVLGERVRPSLEKHLFNFLSKEIITPQLQTQTSLKDYFFSVFQDYQNSKHTVVNAILSRKNRELAATAFLVQLLGTSLSSVPAMSRGGLGHYSSIQAELYHFLEENGYSARVPQEGRIADLQRMVRSRNLLDQPHNYGQFYLSSTMALTNYTHLVAKDHLKFFYYLGALYYYTIRSRALSVQHAQMLHEVFGNAIDTKYFDQQNTTGQDFAQLSFETLIAPAITAYGDTKIQDIAQGFQDFKRLYEIADQDFVTQITWVDQSDLYQEKARRIYHKIQSENMQLPLDTFVEPSSECSTTHIHDAHRLLVIESGVMHFWNALGSSFIFNPGDITLIPSKRLHGSTVLSGECTYHQPIISDELMKEFNKMF